MNDESKQAFTITVVEHRKVKYFVYADDPEQALFEGFCHKMDGKL